MSNNKGFTLMELTIVLAILAIIAAILIPSFLITSDRARMRGDIQSARVIQNASELYRVERGVSPGSDVTAIISRLRETGFLPDREVNTQTRGAEWALCNINGVILSITENSEGLRRAYDSLPDDEKRFVRIP